MVSPWRHGKGRRGFAQGMVWFHAMSIIKVSNALFYGGLHLNHRGIKKPRWFPPQAVETSAV